MRVTVRVALAVVALLVLYLGVTFVQVWWTARQDDATASQAIVVLGAAQYDGTPSPVFEARLDHALDLYEEGLAPTIVVTGGNQPGDRFTEASAGANYLLANGVPDEDIRREVDAHNSWESLAAVARILEDEGVDEVILVSDPYHSYRVGQIADELGMTPHLSPTRSSPTSAWSELRSMARETLAVSVGRFVGYRRLVRIDDQVGRLREGGGG
ncbi:MAG: YdcF family protein [Acidimicrobiales bacterium]|nr:YdcF family protein [Acidimicrobiales bacterium]MCB9374000.1 YdcF family protein [Microthrixaceae bacterium]